MIINHNLAGNNAIRNMNINQTAASKSMQKLSSGLRINNAADDAAGLAISEKMRGQIRGLDQATSNAQDATSLIGTAEGALNETTSILQRMRELAVQSSTDTNTADDRGKIQTETDQLAKEITRISNTTEFNTQNLLAGGLNNTFQIGANKGQNINLSINAMDAQSLGVASAQNEAGTFTASTTTLAASSIGTNDLGRGLSAQTYTIAVTHNASSTSEVNDSVSGGAAISGTYSGDRNESLQVKVTNVTSNQVSGAQYSTDGGTTWTSATVTGAVGSSSISYKGTTITFTDSGSNTAGQIATYTLNAANDSIQLKNGANANVGTAQTVYNDMTSTTIGNAATGETMKINSTSLGSLTTGNATLVVSSTASTAASFNNDGSILAEANTVKGIDVSTQSAANTAIQTIDKAINTVSAERSKLGAYSNRLEHTIANLGTSSENLTSSESRIRDVDMAKEMANFSKNNILSQAAQAMLAQANQMPGQVLQLLK